MQAPKLTCSQIRGFNLFLQVNTSALIIDNIYYLLNVVLTSDYVIKVHNCLVFVFTISVVAQFTKVCKKIEVLCISNLAGW